MTTTSTQISADWQAGRLPQASKDTPAAGVHPAIRSILMQILNNPFKPIPWMLLVHGKPAVTAGQKLALLDEKRKEIAEQIRAAAWSSSPLRMRDVVFLAAITVTFELHHPRTHKQVTGLATTLVGQNTNWLTTALKRSLVEYYCGPDTTLSNRTIERCVKFGVDTSVDLQSIGLARGAVGPWALPGVDIERVFIDKLYLHDERWRGNPIPLVDYAFDTTSSFLVFDYFTAKKIPAYYASLAHMKPVRYIRVEETILRSQN
jgi:hypothetical protein